MGGVRRRRRDICDFHYTLENIVYKLYELGEISEELKDTLVLLLDSGKCDAVVLVLLKRYVNHVRRCKSGV